MDWFTIRVDSSSYYIKVEEVVLITPQRTHFTQNNHVTLDVTLDTTASCSNNSRFNNDPHPRKQWYDWLNEGK